MKKQYQGHLMKNGQEVGRTHPQDSHKEVGDAAEAAGVDFDHVEVKTILVKGEAAASAE